MLHQVPKSFRRRPQLPHIEMQGKPKKMVGKQKYDLATKISKTDQQWRMEKGVAKIMFGIKHKTYQ
jgi:hypothetical protein